MRADMHTATRRIDIADLQPQPLAQAQPETVKREEEYPVAEHARRGDDPLGLFDAKSRREHGVLAAWRANSPDRCGF